MSVRIAIVAATFSVVVGALMFYDYSRRPPKDPLEDPALKALKAAAAQQPANEGLKQEIRRLDQALRNEYFRQRAFAAIGTGLLLGAVVIFLTSAKAAATLRRKLPSPVPQVAPHDFDSEIARLGRWAVATVLLVLVATAVGLGFALQTDLPQGDEQLIASGEATETPSAAQATPSGEQLAASTAPQSAAAKSAPSGTLSAADLPSEAEIAKMWPCFRGPGGLGISAYTNVPTKWNGKSGEGIVWKTAVPLPGNSSPVVWGDRVFLSGGDETRREVFCFDAQKGTLLWHKEAPGTPQSTAEPPKVNEETGFAASTPATDGRRVFAIFPNGDVAGFDFAGKVVWSRSLGMPISSYGYASSLATYKNLLLVQFDQATAKEKKSKVLALDTASGKTVWEALREVPNSWTTPIVIRTNDRDELITAADPWVVAYNPADGKEIWRAQCLRQDVGPSPVFCDGVVYVANQFPCATAIRADGQGDVTKTHVLWKGEDGLPDTCSPLATSRYVFLLATEGTLTCYDAKKGDKLWEKDFDGVNFASSPSAVGKLLYLIANEGKGWVVEPAADGCKIVAESELGEKCVASPAFQDGRIYLRGEKSLFCIGKK